MEERKIRLVASCADDFLSCSVNLNSYDFNFIFRSGALPRPRTVRWALLLISIHHDQKASSFVRPRTASREVPSVIFIFSNGSFLYALEQHSRKALAFVLKLDVREFCTSYLICALESARVGGVNEN